MQFFLASVRLGIAAAAALLLACAGTQPLSEGQRLARSRADLERMFAGQDVPRGPIDVYAAMAHAVRYNLEHRVSLMEQSLEERRVTDARLDMLPRLIANTEYYGRNNYQGSSSRSLITGLESLEPSTSSERYGWRNDLTLAWNILDFGVSWVRARQQANEALIARERRSKVVQDIVTQVHGAYWRAVGAERLLPELEATISEARSALERSRELEAEGLVDPVSSLAYQRSLLDKLRELASLRRELEIARVDLATLINVRPGGPLELVQPDDAALPVPVVDLPIEQLETSALVSRPELREEDYQLRISHLEVRRAMLSVLPGVELRIGRNADTNDFLANDDWWSYSAVLTKNLVEIVTGPAAIRLAQADVDVAEARRLALSMAVLGQVHIAWGDLHAAREELRLAQRVRDVEGRLHEVTHDRYEAERESELELIRKATDNAAAEMRWWLAYADLQTSFGRLQNSVGLDPLRDVEDVEDVVALAEGIRRSHQRWRRNIEIARDYPDASLESAHPASLDGGS